MRRAVAGKGAPESADAEAEKTSGAIQQLSPERYVRCRRRNEVAADSSVNGPRQADLVLRVLHHRPRRYGSIVAMSVNNRNGQLVASFPIRIHDQIMLVTDKGQLIRCTRSRHPRRWPLDPGRHRVLLRDDTWFPSNISAMTARTARTGTAADAVPLNNCELLQPAVVGLGGPHAQLPP